MSCPLGDGEVADDLDYEYLTRLICADLAVDSEEDLTPLVAELNSAGLFGYVQGDDVFRARFSSGSTETPDSSLASYLDAIQKLSAEGRGLFDRAQSRRFDLGFDCGVQPYALSERLTQGLLSRAVSIGIEIEVTIYGYKPPELPWMRDWTHPAELEDGGFRTWSRILGPSYAERINERIRDFKRSFRRQGLRVLELGAGDGDVAVALAKLGHEVTAIEQSPHRIEKAKRLASREGVSVNFLEGDLYADDAGSGYDIVTMWTGFGTRTDAIQRDLLRRVANEWLADSRSRFIVEVTNLSPQARPSGRIRNKYGNCTTETRYSSVSDRLLEKWRPGKDPALPPITRAIRSYSPTYFALLLEGTGLRVDKVIYDDDSYMVILEKAPKRKS